VGAYFHFRIKFWINKLTLLTEVQADEYTIRCHELEGVTKGRMVLRVNILPTKHLVTLPDTCRYITKVFMVSVTTEGLGDRLGVTGNFTSM